MIVVVVVVVLGQAFRMYLGGGKKIYVLRKLGHGQIKEYKFW